MQYFRVLFMMYNYVDHVMRPNSWKYKYELSEIVKYFVKNLYGVSGCWVCFCLARIQVEQTVCVFLLLWRGSLHWSETAHTWL